MAVGYACICVGEYHRFKSIRLKNVSLEKLKKIYGHNLYVLKKYIEYNIRHGICLFRISSDIFPLITREDIHFDWENVFKNELRDIKKLIDENKIKVSMHPGQYTVLSSNNSTVRKKAIIEIDYHSRFLQNITDNDKSIIVIHLGGKYDNASYALKRFYNSYSKLSSEAKKMLCIENDEKMYTAKEVYEFGSTYSIPCIFDNLHNRLNPSYDLCDFEIIQKFSHTFENRKQKMHYSMQNEKKKKGSHSITIDPIVFKEYYDKINGDNLDIMLEVKDKDLSTIKVINSMYLDERKLTEEWARYKYFVMEKNYKDYVEISKLFSNGRIDAKEFYKKINESIFLAYSHENSINTIMHVWGYFKKKASSDEKQRYLKYIEKLQNFDIKIDTVKKFLFSLALKYDVDYLKKSIYFNNVY